MEPDRIILGRLFFYLDSKPKINTMKRLMLLVAMLGFALNITAAEKAKINYVDALKLTHIGKMCKTTNPYHRVEVDKYPELIKKEADLLKMTSGQAILFETDATEIWIQAEYGRIAFSRAMPETAGAGFNLYIEHNGEYVWAASKVNKGGHDNEGNYNRSKPMCLLANMDGSSHKCILYLPLFAELTALNIGVPEGAKIKPMKNPFRHNIAIFGSSFTHGSCATCAGQTYPAFLSRQTGLYLCSFGMSGNSKLQRVMGEILAGTGADAYICDAFSNPTIEQIGERIRPFLNEIRAKNKKAPVIFLRTIYRDGRLFDTKAEKKEADRMAYVDELMKEICAEYKDVYFVDVKDQTGTDLMTSADGIHPCSWGYKRWADAIQNDIVTILAKYGIK